MPLDQPEGGDPEQFESRHIVLKQNSDTATSSSVDNPRKSVGKPSRGRKRRFETLDDQDPHPQAAENLLGQLRTGSDGKTTALVNPDYLNDSHRTGVWEKRHKGNDKAIAPCEIGQDDANEGSEDGGVSVPSPVVGGGTNHDAGSASAGMMKSSTGPFTLRGIVPAAQDLNPSGYQDQQGELSHSESRLRELQLEDVDEMVED